jgi:hypothetical protein
MFLLVQLCDFAGNIYLERLRKTIPELPPSTPKQCIETDRKPFKSVSKPFQITKALRFSGLVAGNRGIPLPFPSCNGVLSLKKRLQAGTTTV